MLLLASYVFYMFWQVEYIFLILISTVIDYFTSLKMGQYEEKKNRKPWLYVSLFANLGLLFVFKYFNFFNSNIASLAEVMDFAWTVKDVELLLPVGISFYTFQTLSYTIDVYRGHYKPEKNFMKFALFVAYFPQLVAGPVERASNIIKQFKYNYDFDAKRATDGVKLMVWGYFKKIVVADRLAVYVDNIFNNPHARDDLSFYVAIYFFAWQLYCDFSGYTDIARGLSRIMGVELMENFTRPYFAKDVGGYWKRWHISMTRWFTDYLFKSLGGLFRNKGRVIANIWIVWTATGLWHGAAWTFIFSGAVHGVFLSWRYGWKMVFCKRYPALKKIGLDWAGPLATPLHIILTFHMVGLCYLFFRANSVGDAMYMIEHMVFIENWSIFIADPPQFYMGLCAVVWLFFIELRQEYFDKPSPFWESNWAPLRWFSYVAYVIVIILFGVFDGGQFVYFQF